MALPYEERAGLRSKSDEPIVGTVHPFEAIKTDDGLVDDPPQVCMRIFVDIERLRMFLQQLTQEGFTGLVSIEVPKRLFQYEGSRAIPISSASFVTRIKRDDEIPEKEEVDPIGSNLALMTKQLLPTLTAEVRSSRLVSWWIFAALVILMFVVAA